jgi:hypothetical protein
VDATAAMSRRPSPTSAARCASDRGGGGRQPLAGRVGARLGLRVAAGGGDYDRLRELRAGLRRADRRADSGTTVPLPVQIRTLAALAVLDAPCFETIEDTTEADVKRWLIHWPAGDQDQGELPRPAVRGVPARRRGWADPHQPVRENGTHPEGDPRGGSRRRVPDRAEARNSPRRCERGHPRPDHRRGRHRAPVRRDHRSVGRRHRPGAQRPACEQGMEGRRCGRRAGDPAVAAEATSTEAQHAAPRLPLPRCAVREGSPGTRATSTKVAGCRPSPRRARPACRKRPGC